MAIVAKPFGKDRGCERHPEVPVLYAFVYLPDGAGTACICDERAVSQRARSELHPVTADGDDVALCKSGTCKIVWISFALCKLLPDYRMCAEVVDVEEFETEEEE